MSQYIGRELSGYRILEQIGQGGMARVYKAYQPGIDRVVALKILPDLYAQDESAKARFRQEAQIIASLEHPHILPVYDCSEEDETAFLVMRYLQAGNLKNLMAAAPNGRLELPDAALLTGQIASALDYAHQKGIVHRDVKPANVMIDPHGQAFLTDFGIAKVLEATQELTKTGSTLGTPAYMSPEQASGGDVDHRSDIYSLGIILYQLLTGTPPFEADTPYATIVAHLQEPLPLPSSLNPEIPEAVEQVLLKALARDPEDRFSSAGELAQALDQALKEEGIEKAQENVSHALLDLSGSLAGDRSSEELTLDDQELLKRATQERRRKKLLPWGVGLLLIVILFAAGILFTQNSKKQTERLILNNQATLEAAPSATYDPTMISEMMQESTQTAQAYLYATETQALFDRHQTQTVIALTPTPAPTVTQTPNPLDQVEYVNVCGLDLCIGNNDSQAIGIIKEFTEVFDPVWSPSGKQIIFTGCRNLTTNQCFPNLFIVNRDGTNLEEILYDPLVNNYHPDLSPDGDRIAFHYSGNVAVIEKNGSNLKVIPGNSNRYCATSVSWSPEGNQFAWLGGGCGGGPSPFVWMYTFSNSNVSLVYDMRSDPQIGRLTWGPDGKWLAFQGQNSLLIDPACLHTAQECNEDNNIEVEHIPDDWFPNASPRWITPIEDVMP